MPRPLEAPPVAAIASDALPLKRGRVYGCPKPSCRSISDRRPLPFLSPVPAIVRRPRSGNISCHRRIDSSTDLARCCCSSFLLSGMLFGLLLRAVFCRSTNFQKQILCFALQKCFVSSFVGGNHRNLVWLWRANGVTAFDQKGPGNADSRSGGCR